MVALSRNIARKHAMRMLLTGDPINAETAFAMGLVVLDGVVIARGEVSGSGDEACVGVALCALSKYITAHS